MKKFLLLLIVPLCFFGVIKKAKADNTSGYEIRFYETECYVPIGGNVYDYLPTAYVYDTLYDCFETDENMSYTYNYQGIKFENINTSRPGHSIGYMYAYNANYSCPMKLQKIDVYVYDDEAPIVSVDTLILKRYNEELNILDYVAYSDNASGLCTIELIGEATLDVVGSYGLTVRVSDSSGNYTDKAISIRVYDDIEPIIECDDVIEIPINSTFNKADYIKVYDDYDGNLEYEIEDIDTTKFGEKNITITATDSSGNTISKTILIKILDDIKPILTVNSYNLNVMEDYDLLDNIIELSDNYDELTKEDVVITKKRIGTKQFQVNYEVKDSSNDISSLSIIVNYDYYNKPIIEGIHLDDLKDEFDPLYYVNCYDVEDGDLNNKVMVIYMNYEEKYCIYEVYDSDNNLTRKKIDFVSSDSLKKYEQNNKISFPTDDDISYNPISDSETNYKDINEYKSNNYNYLYYILLGVFVLGIIIFIIIKHFKKKMV